MERQSAARTQQRVDCTKQFATPLPSEMQLRQCVDKIVVTLVKINTAQLSFNCFSVIDQLLRSATSISANLCEGRGRASTASMQYFASVSRGSLFETFDHLRTLKCILEALSENGLFAEVSAAEAQMVSASSAFERDWLGLIGESKDFKFEDDSSPKVDDFLIISVDESSHGVDNNK